MIFNREKETNNVIIFVHIPKTGGLTLYSIIDNQYKDYCHIRGPVHEIVTLKDEEKKRIEVLRGHFQFGIHNDLPQKEYTYMTILRNPIEQVISHFYEIRSSKTHSLCGICNEITLLEYVTSDRFFCNTVNQQTRHIAGNKYQDDLETAKCNLKKYFSVVGITERYDETLYIIEKKLGWKIDNYQRLNVSTNKPPIEEIPKNIIEIIKEKNQKDIELYELANRLLDEQLQILKDSSFIK